MILPGTGRGTVGRKADGGGGVSLRKPAVYLARKLRRSMTMPEAMLWRELRDARLGFKVRRQHPCGPYVLDFFVPHANLAIEIDGECHARGRRPMRDARRDAYLRERGIDVFRLGARDVLENLEGVLTAIAERSRSPLHHQAALDGPPPRPGEELR